MICLSLAGSVFALLRIFTIEQPESFSLPPMEAMARKFGKSMAICASLVTVAAALCFVSQWVRRCHCVGNLRLFTDTQPIDGPSAHGG